VVEPTIWTLSSGSASTWSKPTPICFGRCTFMQALMSAEADAMCGAPYGERSEERTNRRNGYRERDFDTRTGTMALQIPKLRSGSYCDTPRDNPMTCQARSDSGYSRDIRRLSRVSTTDRFRTSALTWRFALVVPTGFEPVSPP
jgi:hypothetical protein